VETVGVGQDQVSIVQMAHTVLLVIVPGLGDYLQSLKAGVLEIGDIFVVNKSDRQGADQAVADIEMMLGMNGSDGVWRPPVLKTVAADGAGTEELMRQIDRHRQVLEETQSIHYRRRCAARTEILELINARCLQRIAEGVNLDELLEAFAERTCEGFSDPYTAADEILKKSGIF
jgi:LAO/AO transport system kinase